MTVRRRTSQHRALALCSLLLAASALLFPGRASLQGEPLLAAWDRAREAGAYRFTADVE